MSSDVARPYSGQHGYETSIWPVPREYILSEDEIVRDNRIGSAADELVLSYGNEVAGTVSTINTYYRKIIFATIAYLTATMALLTWLGTKESRSLFIGVAVGVAANALTAFFVFDFSRFRRMIKR